MRFFVLALCAIALMTSCKTGQAVTVDQATLAASDCGSTDVQRLITYCASPQAADLAARNAELMGSTKRADGDVPYSPLPIGNSPVRGPETAPVTIVMFTDLECPYCREMHDTLNALAAESPDQIRVVFKHTPLAFHQMAVPAALGALAAREQGKFWEYVDLAYAKQDTLDQDALLAHATTLGLDLEQFQNDFGSKAHIEAIEEDLSLAAQVGVSGTPTMFVNGMRVVGVFPTEDVRALVENQKELVARLQEAGVPKNDLYWRLVSVQYQPAPESNIDEAPEYEEPEVVVAHVPIDGSPVRGATADDALVTIVEFSDFQCPYCAGAVGVVDAVLAEHGEYTRLSFRHFPLGNHPQAGPAAVASLIAQAGDKFWEFHNLLFSNQNDLSNEALVAHAKSLELDPKEVEAALEDADLQARVGADQKLGIDLGVRGTPTFMVNGIMVMGIESPEAFSALVADQAKVAKAVAEKTGLKGDALYEAVVKHNQAAMAAQ